MLLWLATRFNGDNINTAPAELDTFLFISLFTFLEMFDGLRVVPPDL